MNEVYRGHEIVLLEGPPLSAVLIERRSGATLPTKVTALPNEGEYACLKRARQLVDLYLQPRRHRAAAE
ncbi:MAG TPA: hypothetical protein VHB74_04340 [Devosia sp.]|jgi:hypothetical protein|nr:hypothetical protein [Devosia sp.]